MAESSDGSPPSREAESGFSQPESKTPDSSESTYGFTALAMEETSRREGSLCSGRPSRPRTEPLGAPLSGGAVKSTPHTAPHPLLEPYEPTQQPSSTPTEKAIGSPSSSPPAEPTAGPSGACGGDPNSPDQGDPSTSFSDDMAESNNRTPDSAVDGGKADEEMAKSLSALEVQAKIKMGDDVEYTYNFKGDPVDVHKQTKVYMDLVEKARSDRRASTSSSSSQKEQKEQSPLNKNMPPIIDDTKPPNNK